MKASCWLKPCLFVSKALSKLLRNFNHLSAAKRYKAVLKMILKKIYFGWHGLKYQKAEPTKVHVDNTESPGGVSVI